MVEKLKTGAVSSSSVAVRKHSVALSTSLLLINTIPSVFLERNKQLITEGYIGRASYQASWEEGSWIRTFIRYFSAMVN